MRSGFSPGRIVRRSTAKFLHPSSTLDERRNAELVTRAPIAALASPRWVAQRDGAPVIPRPKRKGRPGQPGKNSCVRGALTLSLSASLAHRLASFGRQLLFGAKVPLAARGVIWGSIPSAQEPFVDFERCLVLRDAPARRRRRRGRRGARARQTSPGRSSGGPGCDRRADSRVRTPPAFRSRSSGNSSLGVERSPARARRDDSRLSDEPDAVLRGNCRNVIGREPGGSASTVEMP